MEDSLVLGESNPVGERDFQGLKKIMRDCAHPELKTAYSLGYDTFRKFVKAMGITAERYSIHILTNG